MKSVLRILSILILVSIAASAADLFGGKWKGEIAAGPCGGFGAPGGGTPGGGFPGGGGRGGGPGFDFAPEMVQRGGGFPGAADGGIPGGPNADRRGGTQKVTLNIKVKEDKKAAEAKLTGNITIGDNTEDIRDGIIDGSKISFTTGKPPKAVCQYAGELDAEANELRMTRKIVGSNAAEIHLTLKR